ncbi:DUF3870 domain-containing protein [Metabacillus arenae]|uniref:DUF3870 domain-containing protein n=1 Tax=Metabacillus arenae TaxID=2771434 RepID=A0A926NGU8_9BACI|nr:DUF3870 domain-containing protein [Metabacillus arenae]MBD1380293.1 DUF3870 domain-containing protein [Metabacillus arenae]
MFHRDTVYVIGDSKTSSSNPIMHKYNAFFVGLVIDLHTHEIVDAECSSIVELTTRFVRSLLIGKSILEIEKLTEEIERRYFGSSQRALIVALKNASIKYEKIKGS